MRPGEVILAPGDGVLHAGRKTVLADALNSSDHTVFVSSHYPVFEGNRRLAFDGGALAWGRHLDLPAGDSERCPPGETGRVRPVAHGGGGGIRGGNGLTEGAATPDRLPKGVAPVTACGYAHRPTDEGE